MFRTAHRNRRNPMKRRFRSSFGALQAFEAAARHASFARASDELNLTQGAISRQIRGLEAALGVQLFQLVRQRVVLTEFGRRYLIDVRQTIDALEEATLRIMASGSGIKTLELATLPTFCSRWLIPRLPRFYAIHPGVLVNCTSRLLPIDFGVEPFDAVIHFGAPAWPGGVLTHLCVERLVAVCSPEFRSRHRIRTESDLVSAPLLQHLTRPSAWADWFARIGRHSSDSMRGARYDQISMLSQAAVAGLGAALLPQFLIEEELRTGRLSIVGQATLESSEGYYLVVPETKAGVPLIEDFRTWLLGVLAET